MNGAAAFGQKGGAGGIILVREHTGDGDRRTVKLHRIQHRAQGFYPLKIVSGIDDDTADGCGIGSGKIDDFHTGGKMSGIYTVCNIFIYSQESGGNYRTVVL